MGMTLIRCEHPDGFCPLPAVHEVGWQWTHLPCPLMRELGYRFVVLEAPEEAVVCCGEYQAVIVVKCATKWLSLFSEVTMIDFTEPDEEYVDALDCDCVSLEEAGLEERNADTVPAALRGYWVDEYAYHEVLQ